MKVSLLSLLLLSSARSHDMHRRLDDIDPFNP